jgi:ribonuclease HI
MRYQAALLPVNGRFGMFPLHSRPRTFPVKATLFADGGSRGNPGPAASGAVIFDEAGEVLREVGTFLGTATNNVAEWTGLVTGLEAAIELGVDDLAVRLDSELVVRQIDGQYRVKNEALIPLHARAKVLLRKFAKVDVRHVPRKQNAAADALVNQVLDANRP